MVPLVGSYSISFVRAQYCGAVVEVSDGPTGPQLCRFPHAPV
jgi:hypothetical protein